MKRLIRACIVFLVVTSPFCLGCVDSSDYGGPVDITEMLCIFYDDAGVGETKECALPGVFISGNETTANLLDVEFSFVNYSLNRVRLNRMNVEYTAPWGPAIPNHSQRMAVDIPPAPENDPEAGSDEKQVPVSLWSLEQTRHVYERKGQYPATPFLVNCKVTFFYNTSGGQEQSLEREVTIELL
jgi:hypothetical protein